METLSPDLCVIGGGSGGLSVAAGAAQMGARTVLLERHLMGGECLNSGCVPSKALLAAAHEVHMARKAMALGVEVASFRVDMNRVWQRVQETIAAIAPHDSQERFESLGVRVIRQEGRFTAPDEVAAGDVRIRARRFVVATGSRPAVPPIAGLKEAPFFTNENLFTNRLFLPHLLVLGGGPIGLEMAQAYRRLGSEVTVVERARLLPRADAEAAEVVRQALENEGVRFLQGVEVNAVSGEPGAITLHLRQDGRERILQGSHLLVAVGRKPNLEALELAAAGIVHTPSGITVDGGMRTSNRRVYAIGDVCGGPLFTHAAGYQAGIVIRHALFRLPARVDYTALPQVTYTDPELAQVGLSEEQARERGLVVRVLRKPFAENDRARAEGTPAGFVKVVVEKRGRVLGATLVGDKAGELLQPWILALHKKLKIADLATLIAPYPTLGEINKGVAGGFFTQTLYSSRTRKLVAFLSRFG
ncbi:MAG: FAD-dependent oxidoreductase [Magnetococcales bacterium]|nr:FAD-dependent oxidoreductase [Magnetococcales bacterium]